MAIITLQNRSVTSDTARLIAGLKLWNWYPEGGFGEVVRGVKAVAEENGAAFEWSTVLSPGAMRRWIITPVSMGFLIWTYLK